MDQQGSPCCHNVLTISPSNHSKMNPVGHLGAEKLAEAVWLFVFKIAFPASLFAKHTYSEPII